MQTFNSLKEDFAFGQYRFESLETVLAKDPGYVIWLRKTGKIEVNCLYIGASQAELDRCIALKRSLLPPTIRTRLSVTDYAKLDERAPAWASAAEDYYSEEDRCTYSTVNHQGCKVPVSYNDDGTSTVYWGGPCGSQDYDENGEAC